MSAISPGYLDDFSPRPSSSEPACDAAITPDEMHDSALVVSLLAFAALAITVAGAVLAG